MAQFTVSNVEKEKEVYGYEKVVKSHCRMCHGGCGVFVYLKGGKIEKITGDPDCPVNHGTLCSKGDQQSGLLQGRALFPSSGCRCQAHRR